MKKLNKKGFTLIEVVVVMAIIAVLALLVIGAIAIARGIQKDTVAKATAKNAQTLLEAKFASGGSYPGTTGAKNFITFTSGGANATLLGGSLTSNGCTNGGGSVEATTTAYTIRFYKNASDCATEDTTNGSPIQVGQ